MDIVEINKHNTKEVEVLIDLMHQQMLDINSEKDRSSIASAIRNALKPDSRAIFFLAKQNEIPIGAAFINICSGIESGGDYVWINEIQIIPEFRGKGFGSRLLRHILEWSKSNNMKAMLSIAGIKNTVSQSLFKSAGFAVEDIKWMKKYN
jgi:GNAT superfamily N-acetyltransferase